MFGRIVVIAIVIGAGYWFWSGPYQQRINPSYEAVLEENARNMAECMRTEAYKRGTTGGGLAEDAASEQCAEQFNLYEQNGKWHSYDMNRREN